MSNIEWTERTWNPVAGCSLVSPGCTNCYAMRMAARLVTMGQAKYAGTTHKVNGHHVWTGKINLDELALSIPLKRKKPTMWFVNSMSDLFHEDVAFDYINRVFAMMALTPRHTYQILTKRPERMAEYLADPRVSNRVNLWACVKSDSDIIPEIVPGLRNSPVQQWPLPNVWLGASVEDQKRADERIPNLLRCPAAVRFLSVEPLLGAVDLCEVELPDGDGLGTSLFSHGTGTGIDWVIVGGESGAGARPCNVEWIRSIVGQCKAAGVACFVKQLGAKPYIEPYAQEPGGKAPPRFDLKLIDPKGGNMLEWGQFGTDLRVRQMPQQPAAT